jgi:predicted TIM-barrel fold metal-dependent hydrolase
VSSRVFDAHLHIIDPSYPLIENEGYLPPAFTVEQYRERTAGLGIAGGAIVSGSFQGFDQSCLINTLSRLGPNFVGVTQLPESASDEEILTLDEAGVRAIRFNIRRGGSPAADGLDRLARRVHEIAGWHAELYIDARTLPEMEGTLAALPAVSIDHLGLHEDGLPHLLRLVERGLKVKASGFGRAELDPAEAIAAILSIDPTALMFGTDLPSTRARREFSVADLDLVRQVVPAELLDDVLWSNAAGFYRLPAGDGGTAQSPTPRTVP